MIKSFEGARGLAAVLVALYHFGVASKYIPVVEYGYLFVDLFFVLSGFVMTATYESRIAKFADIKPYMMRRFGRLFPLMIFSTLLFVLAYNSAMWIKSEAASMGYANLFKNPGALKYIIPSIGEVVGAVTLTQGMGFFDKPILNQVSWSIGTEFYTYVLFAVICAALRGRNRTIVFTLLSVTGMIVTAWASLDLHGCVALRDCNNITFDFGFARCVGAFFLGALAYRLNQAISFDPMTIQMLTLLLLIAFFSLIGAHPLIAFGFPFVCALLVIAISRDTGFLATLLQRKPFQVLGERSFSIYMLHPAVLVFFSPIATMVNRTGATSQGILLSAAAIALFLAVVVAASAWTYAWIEAPCRAWFNRAADNSQIKRRIALP